jgi:ribonuclease BN (tRNA processing enzyme)
VADNPRVPERGRSTGVALTIIGSAPAWSLRPGRASSCYLVELEGQAIILDLGQGALGQLAAFRRLESVLAVLVSHAHPDHHVDLMALRQYLRWGLGQPGRVALHAPVGLRAHYDAFMDQPGFLDELPGDDLAEGQLVIGPFLVEARPVTHTPGAFAFRVSAAAETGAAGLVYSGDCGRWQDLQPLIRPGDTLLCEAFWGAGEPEAADLHLTARDAADAARTGRAARLVLTHIAEAADTGAALEVAARHAGASVALADPGLRIVIE